MKCDCHVVRDLLPLYVDNLCEEKTRLDIENHLSQCAECQSLYETLKEESPQEIPISTENINPFLKIKKLQNQRLILAVVLTLCLTLGGYILYEDYQGSERQMLKEVIQVMESKDLPAIYHVNDNIGFFWGRKGNQSYIELYVKNDGDYRFVYGGSTGQEVDGVFVINMINQSTIVASYNKPRIQRMCIYQNEELKEEIYFNPNESFYYIVNTDYLPTIKLYDEKGRFVEYEQDLYV